MEPQNNDQITDTKVPSALHLVTPLSKYLAMALFVVLPFLGGWIGYMYAPEKPIQTTLNTQQIEQGLYSNEVENRLEQTKEKFVSEPIANRILVSRQYLFDNEDELYDKFGLEKWRAGQDSSIGATGDLYTELGSKNIKTTYTLYQDNGISLLLPYEEDYGYPHYRLTAYDVVDGGIIFGEISPCPMGCTSAGGYTSQLNFYPAGSLEQQLEAWGKRHFLAPSDYCRSFKINSTLEGVFCETPINSGTMLLFEGLNFVYGLTNMSEILLQSIIVE